MKRKIILMIFVLMLCIGVTACNKEAEEGDMNDDNNNTEYTNKKENEEDNVIFSPYSLDMCMALLINGTEGDSLSQFEKYMGSNKDKINKHAEKQIAYYNNLSKDFLEQQKTQSVQDEEYTKPAVLLANSVWGNSKSFKFDEKYLKNVSDKFDANAESLDFSLSSTTEKINDWCKRKTYGLIPNIVDADELESCETILTNALYFKAAWNSQYKEANVEKDNFNNCDGTKSEVDMMKSFEKKYFENDDVTGFLKNYDGAGLYFAGILPKKEGDFNMSDLNIDEIVTSIKKANTDTTNYNVMAKLPKFEIETEQSLVDMLKENGVVDIFDAGKANLSKFGKSIGDNPLFVSDVKQKAKITLDEKGTEAAAVTAAMMKMTSLPPQDIVKKEVVLDRPFAFLIYDMENDVILFQGKMANFKN